MEQVATFVHVTFVIFFSTAPLGCGRLGAKGVKPLGCEPAQSQRNGMNGDALGDVIAAASQPSFLTELLPRLLSSAAFLKFQFLSCNVPCNAVALHLQGELVAPSF
jgi:hypothetical protein